MGDFLQPEFLEANASHAVGQYLTRGPSLPPAEMRVRGLEGVRARLSAYPTAANMLVYGWVAVEQGFAVAANPQLHQKYSLDPLYADAENGFTDALDLYEPEADRPTHLREVELAMSALPLYRRWTEQAPLDRDVIAEFQDETVEVAESLLDMRATNGSDWESDTRKSVNGFASEVALLLGYNRRAKAACSGFTVAVPSTYRQNAARQKGPSGSAYDKSRVRENWDVSIVSGEAGKLALAGKVQVKSVITIPGLPGYGRLLQGYAEDILPIGLSDHVCRPLGIPDQWKVIETLVEASRPGAPKTTKTMAANISRALFERLP
ncbi:MAG TPA: hypothetical protein VLH84_05265 [Patescibacteria group bacterium]|nr:hypothetical protein [Patescibacteria group bacterium]